MNKSLTLKKRNDSENVLSEFAIGDSIVTVGSVPGSTVELRGTGIAPEQFIILAEGGEVVLMNRAEGTLLNGEELRPGARFALAVGDRIEVEDYVVLLEGAAKTAKVSNSADAEQPEIARAAAVSGGTAVREPAVTGETAEKSEASEPVEEVANERDFSKILYELKDEDTFYFHVRDSEDVVQRIAFVEDQMWVGTKLGNVEIAAEENRLEEVFARVNKDWSGVVVYPRSDQTTYLNGAELLKPERLRNEDAITLLDDFESAEIETVISFHEPVSLLALSSILPGELPEPVSSKETADEPGKTGMLPRPAVTGVSATGETTGPKLIMGYYTFLEVLVMAFGTLVTAAIIFFVLEFV